MCVYQFRLIIYTDESMCERTRVCTCMCLRNFSENFLWSQRTLNPLLDVSLARVGGIIRTFTYGRYLFDPQLTDRRKRLCSFKGDVSRLSKLFLLNLDWG